MAVIAQRRVGVGRAATISSIDQGGGKRRSTSKLKPHYNSKAVGSVFVPPGGAAAGATLSATAGRYAASASPNRWDRPRPSPFFLLVLSATRRHPVKSLQELGAKLDIGLGADTAVIVNQNRQAVGGGF